MVPPDNISERQVRAQLNRVLASKALSRSKALRLFLEFIVTETVADRTDTLKEYSIGSQVFERGEDFDPRIDSIVRVQAGKLRERLARYYREEAADDEIRIELKPGSYVPSFAHSSSHSGQQGLAARRDSNRESDSPVLAVLPFLNLTGDAQFDYFTDGLGEELISRVGRISGLQVIARTSSFAFKHKSSDLSEIGQAVGANLILEGSVQKSGDVHRVTARLTEAASSRSIWSHSYNGGLEDALGVQDDIAQRIAHSIGASVDLGHSPHPVSIDSHLLLLRGWRHWHRNDPVHLSKAIECFGQAVEIDNTNVQAHAGLAFAWTILGVFYATPARTASQTAELSARNAVRHGKDSAESWGALGAVEATFNWNWQAGEFAFQRAFEINPNYATGHHAYAASCLLALGRFQDAVREMTTVLRLDPLSVLASCDLGTIQTYAGMYDAAIRQYEVTLQMEPNNPRALVEKGWALSLDGRMEDGLESVESGLALMPELAFFWGMYALVLAIAGRRGDALRALEKMRSVSPDGQSVTVFPGFTHEVLGSRATALEEFEQAFERRDPHSRFLGIVPQANLLREEPRFLALLRQMRLD